MDRTQVLIDRGIDLGYSLRELRDRYGISGDCVHLFLKRFYAPHHVEESFYAYYQWADATYVVLLLQLQGVPPAVVAGISGHEQAECRDREVEVVGDVQRSG